jgi:hypothetical protein
MSSIDAQRLFLSSHIFFCSSYKGTFTTINEQLVACKEQEFQVQEYSILISQAIKLFFSTYTPALY